MDLHAKALLLFRFWWREIFLQELIAENMENMKKSLCSNYYFAQESSIVFALSEQK